MWLTILAITAQTLDTATTCHNLSKGYRELNPVMGQSCERIAMTKMAVLVPTLVLLKDGPVKTSIKIGAIAAGGIGFSINISKK